MKLKFLSECAISLQTSSRTDDYKNDLLGLFVFLEKLAEREVLTVLIKAKEYVANFTPFKIGGYVYYFAEPLRRIFLPSNYFDQNNLFIAALRMAVWINDYWLCFIYFRFHVPHRWRTNSAYYRFPACSSSCFSSCSSCCYSFCSCFWRAEYLQNHKGFVPTNDRRMTKTLSIKCSPDCMTLLLEDIRVSPTEKGRFHYHVVCQDICFSVFSMRSILTLCRTRWFWCRIFHRSHLDIAKCVYQSRPMSKDKNMQRKKPPWAWTSAAAQTKNTR